MENRYRYMNDIDSCIYHLSELIFANWEQKNNTIEHVQTQKTSPPPDPT